MNLISAIISLFRKKEKPAPVFTSAIPNSAIHVTYSLRKNTGPIVFTLYRVGPSFLTDHYPVDEEVYKEITKEVILSKKHTSSSCTIIE